MQCLAEYRSSLTEKLRGLRDTMPMVTKLSALAVSRQRSYSSDPLQCPIGINLYDDIVQTRTYENDLEEISLQNQLLENTLLTGSIEEILNLCTSSATSSSQTTLEDLLSAFT